MKKMIALICLLTFTGCADGNSNPRFEIAGQEFLGTIEGYPVNKFRDEKEKVVCYVHSWGNAISCLHYKD